MKRQLPHTFVAFLEDRPGALNRVVSLVRRRGFNISSLAVGTTEQPGVSRLTLVVQADQDTARRLEASLYKLVDVLEVQDLTGAPALAREFAIVKVQARASQKRSEVLRLGDALHARVVDLGPRTVTLEFAGAPEKVDGLVEMMRPFGIAEMVRTGPLAMGRGAEVQEAVEVAAVAAVQV
jgi:acetolactate synthase-1/3 small subunit